MDNDKIKMLIHKVGLNNNLQDHIINKIVNSQFKFTRKIITELDIPKDITEEEFEKIKTNFIYKGIGKIHTNYRLFNKIRKHKEHLKQRYTKEDEQHDT